MAFSQGGRFSGRVGQKPRDQGETGVLAKSHYFRCETLKSESYDVPQGIGGATVEGLKVVATIE